LPAVDNRPPQKIVSRNGPGGKTEDVSKVSGVQKTFCTPIFAEDIWGKAVRS
jgi:hypothetical protein